MVSIAKHKKSSNGLSQNSVTVIGEMTMTSLTLVVVGDVLKNNMPAPQKQCRWKVN